MVPVLKCLDYGNSVVFGVCRHDVSPGGAILQTALPSVFVPFFVPVLPLDRNISGLKYFQLGGWLQPSTRVHAYLVEVVSTGSICPYLHIMAKVIPIGSWEPHISMVPGTLQWLSPETHSSCYLFLFDFLTLFPNFSRYCHPYFLLLSSSLVSISIYLSQSSCFPLNAGLKHTTPDLPSFYAPYGLQVVS